MNRSARARSAAPASVTKLYLATFRFKHVAVMYAIEKEVASGVRTIVPYTEWDLTELNEYADCFATFEHDEPFDDKELEVVRQNIELMDTACDAMIKGTAAEEEGT